MRQITQSSISHTCFSSHWKPESGSYLQSKDTNTPRTLHNNPLARLQLPQAVQRVPRRHGGAAERARLDVAQVGGRAHEPRLGKSGVLAQHAWQRAAEGRADRLARQLAVLVALVEERDDAVALLPARDAGADGDDLAGAVRAGYLGEVEGEGVDALMSPS